MQNLFTILSLIALAYFGFQLYSRLGKREGHMEAPSRDSAERPMTPDVADKPVMTDIPLGPAAEGLGAIARADPHFDPAVFLEGARKAYQLIVDAFAAGDKDALRALLNTSVFDRYAEAIDGRRARGETVKTEIERIAEAEITEASLIDGMAKVKVAFTADIATETRDREGGLVAGDIDRLNTVRETWSFERRVAAGDPNWALAGVATV
jgi:predicted lipid-binding transport protein (Tim44 family)